MCFTIDERLEKKMLFASILMVAFEHLPTNTMHGGFFIKNAL
jgi:hypothetical protein